MSPLRAVVAAHLEGSFNRARRQFGTLGVVTTWVIIGLGFAVFVLPFVAGMTVMGFLLGDCLQGEGNAERNLSAIALFLTGLTVFGGAFAGLSGASRQLPWEALQAYPVSPRALFAAELVACATEVLTVAELLALAGVCAGIAVASPAATPFLVLAFVLCVLTTMSIQLAVASVAQRVSKQARVVVVLLPVLAVLWSVGTPRVWSTLTAKAPTAIGDFALAAGLSSPMGQLLLGARAPYGGTDWSNALWQVLPGLMLAVGAVLLAYALVSREKPIAAGDDVARSGKLWSFSSQTFGMARLQFEVLATSLPGRAMLLMPLLTIVLIRGPLAHFFSQGPWVVPAAFLYAGLSSTNLLFNQFGLDRHGVKALLLLPIDERALLEGKQWAFATWQALQALLLTVLLMLSGFTAWAPLLMGLGLATCSFLLCSMVGQFMSIWQPHPLTKNGMRGMRPPLVVVLATMATVFVGGGSLFMFGSMLQRSLPRAGGLVMLVLALGLFGASRALLRFNTGFLRASRERLVESLSATA